MTTDRWDALLERDWSEAWDTLPEGPEIVPRPKTAQITLRVPLSLLARIKRVAAARTLPYHALARSWIIDGIRRTDMSQEQELDIEPQTVQLNLKLTVSKPELTRCMSRTIVWLDSGSRGRSNRRNGRSGSARYRHSDLLSRS
jgi:hypothetical protein